MPRLALILCLSAVAIAFGGEGEPVYYPTGYQHWALAKFKFIGPENPGWATQGGLRHHFANDVALSSWGNFSEGSVIVDERVHTRLNDQKVWVEAGPAHVAVMRKDRRFGDTGGWHFNFFAEGDTRDGISHERAKERCFDACHKAQAARDFVFSDPRR